SSCDPSRACRGRRSGQADASGAGASRRRMTVKRGSQPRGDAVKYRPVRLRRDETMETTEALAQYLAPGRVHRRLYTDPAIFALEMDRIFYTAWVYVGHESQIKQPGDYFATHMGPRPVILVRDMDGTVR